MLLGWLGGDSGEDFVALKGGAALCEQAVLGAVTRELWIGTYTCANARQARSLVEIYGERTLEEKRT